MNRTKVITGILIIFILGGITGALGTRFFVIHKIQKFTLRGGPPPPVMFLERSLRRMDLTEQQHDEIRKVLDELHNSFKVLAIKYKPEFEAMFDTHIEKMRSLLNDAQIKEMDEKLKLLKARLKHLEKNRNRKPPPFMHEPHERRMDAPFGPHDKNGSAFVDDLIALLELTPEQTVKVRAALLADQNHRHDIIEKFGEQITDLRNRRDDEIRQHLRKTQETLAHLLTREQLEKYRGLQDEFEPFPHPPEFRRKKNINLN